MKEIFRDVKGYEEDYQVSNLGRVLSFKYGKERILKQAVNTGGYLVVNLCENGKNKIKIVHKLVAIAFLNHIPNGHKLVVDHVDNNQLNNKADNLQLIHQRLNATKDRKSKYSNYKGVFYNKANNNWRGQVVFKGKMFYTKSTETELEAYMLYKVILNELNLVNYNEIN